MQANNCSISTRPDFSNGELTSKVSIVCMLNTTELHLFDQKYSKIYKSNNIVKYEIWDKPFLFLYIF